MRLQPSGSVDTDRPIDRRTATRSGPEREPPGAGAGGRRDGALRKERSVMRDAIFVGVIIGFFVLTRALIRLCERL